MKDQFYLHFPTMPKGTAQQKGYNRKTGRYFKKNNVASAEHAFKVALIPHRPLNPSDKPIKLTVMFAFDTKNKKLWGQPKPTRPDTENYLKLFKDCMTDCGFWIDDAQVWDERVVKTYAESASIMVRWEETDVSEMKELIKQLEELKERRKFDRWIPVSERLPNDLEPVNITWINHNPEPYYKEIKDKPFTATGVYFNGQWYWWSTLCTDILAEYSNNYDDVIDADIEVIAWQPLPEPYKKGGAE